MVYALQADQIIQLNLPEALSAFIDFSRRAWSAHPTGQVGLLKSAHQD
ncbi:MAG: hypothetical protein PHQ40_21325 [Anaerolineaceae bacterium]|nr:hypothetical protein [Anaerolineaceae bacterium]